MIVSQINLQTTFGGGERFTSFLSNALNQLGYSLELYTHPAAKFWNNISLPPSVRLIPVNPKQPFAALIHNSDKRWIIAHSPLPSIACSQLREKNNFVTAIAHLPYNQRDPAKFENHDYVFGVSKWVISTLKSCPAPVWPSPLYGVAELPQNIIKHDNDVITRNSRYLWDTRKFRDKILSYLEPGVKKIVYGDIFKKRAGLTLGIVSRITPIKQFPTLFDSISKTLSNHQDINIEIFGGGGFASIRDLDNSILAIKNQVRFWGHQENVSLVYKNIDYMLTGLPEKEALGLNVLESQQNNTPVLAVSSPPFTETVVNATTGYLYCDPRDDDAKDFGMVIEKIASTPLLEPINASEHLKKFSQSSFTTRIKEISEFVEEKMR